MSNARPRLWHFPLFSLSVETSPANPSVAKLQGQDPGQILGSPMSDNASSYTCGMKAATAAAAVVIVLMRDRWHTGICVKCRCSWLCVSVTRACAQTSLSLILTFL